MQVVNSMQRVNWAIIAGSGLMPLFYAHTHRPLAISPDKLSRCRRISASLLKQLCIRFQFSCLCWHSHTILCNDESWGGAGSASFNRLCTSAELRIHWHPHANQSELN